MNTSSLFLLAGVWLIPSFPALAADARPTEPAAPVPPFAYRSAFEGYRPFQEQPITDWRTLNSEVGAAGGHIGIMGGASGHAGHGGPAKSPPAPAGAGPKPSPDAQHRH